MNLVSTKLRNSARGRDCTVRLVGICNFDTETTVLAHLPVNQKGMSIKSPDLFAVFACSCCHDVIDRRRPERADAADLLRALAETMLIWLKEGLITVK